MLMSLLWFIVVGLVCGAIARALFPGKQPMGLGATALLGMGGSLLGGLVGSIVSGGLSGATIRPAGWIFSILGSLLLLYAISRRR
ncbi:MAG: GlsB/YeaQ/YmgE family stress response membrane protein [Myxococcaceae bacterium]